MRNTSTWAVLALFGLTSSCSPENEAPQHSAQVSASTLAFANVLATRVKDIRPGPDDGLPERIKPYFHLHALGSTLFLRADDGASGPALWRSDGTESGTRLVKDFTSDTSENLGDEPAVLGGAMYFFATSGDGSGLWRQTEGAAEPVLVHPLSPRGMGATALLRVFGDRLAFLHTTAETGTELWVSDGTTAGTHLLADVRAGSASSEPQYIRAMGSTLFFTADDGVHGRELWRSDGSAPGTALVKDIRTDGDGLQSYGTPMRAAADAIYFAANDGAGTCGLWRSNGTEAETRLVKALPEACERAGITETEAAGTRLFFAVQVWGAEQRQLWVSDGTPEGTVSLMDALPTGTGTFGGLITLGDRLLFVGPGSSGGTALWRSDGTPAGTVRVKDVAVAADNFYGYQILDGLLVFRGDDGVHGKELWRSDGTPEGTFMVADVRPGPDSSDASHFALAGDTLYFRATDGVSGYEPWSIPMAKVHDPFPPSVTCPADIVVVAATQDGVPVSYPAAQASDNTSTVVSYSHPSGSVFPVGTTQVAAMAQDPAQNRAGCTFEVTVRREEAFDQLPGEGKGCATAGGQATGWLALLGALVWMRRRRNGAHALTR